jgi:hypothetical protein
LVELGWSENWQQLYCDVVQEPSCRRRKDVQPRQQFVAGAKS